MGTPSESDTEKGQAKIASSSPEPSTSPIVEEGEWRPVSWLRSSFPKFLTGAFVETRGIERVPAEERIKPSAANYLQMVLIWFSANLSANNIAVGLLGPSVYQLSYLDSALCATFGSIVGCAATAFTSTWGPKSGNRTMVSTGIGGWLGTALTTWEDCGEVYHGLVAKQNLRSPEHGHHVRLWDDW
jgi:hypothetical protein